MRYREPIYKTLRELALSYFHEYFDDLGRKNLREYSTAVNLNQFNYLNWRRAQKNLWAIPKALNKAKHFWLVNKNQLRSLRRAGAVEIAAGKLVEWKKSGHGAKQVKY